MGEKQGDRAALDRVTERLMTVYKDPRVAREKARESLRRVDAKQRREGKR